MTWERRQTGGRRGCFAAERPRAAGLNAQRDEQPRNCGSPQLLCDTNPGFVEPSRRIGRGGEGGSA